MDRKRMALYAAFGTCLVAGAAVVAVQAPSSAQFSITGSVLDSTGKPVENVEVMVVTERVLRAVGKTDVNGRYSVSVTLERNRPVRVLFQSREHRPGAVQYAAGHSTNTLTTVMLKPGEISDELSSAIEGATTSFIKTLGKGPSS